MSTEYAVAWQADNGSVIALYDTTTVVREHAYESLVRFRQSEREEKGRPDLLFVARRPIPTWERDPEPTGREHDVG